MKSSVCIETPRLRLSIPPLELAGRYLDYFERNREHLAGRVVSTVDPAVEALCFDPQTSGGLLVAAAPAHGPALVDAGFTVVGRVEAGAAGVELG